MLTVTQQNTYPLGVDMEPKKELSTISLLCARTFAYNIMGSTLQILQCAKWLYDVKGSYAYLDFF